MATTANADAKAARLMEVLKPHLLQLLRDAPEYGEISLAATIHDGDIGRIRLGAEISRAVAPRGGRS